MEELTTIIKKWQQGDKEAESQLYLFAYQQLHRIAKEERQRSAEKYGLDNKVLQDCAGNTTALIHEAYLKLANSNTEYLQNRRQFYLMAATVMRQILIDNARNIQAKKRQPDQQLSEKQEHHIDNLLSVEKALDNFSLHYPRQAEVIKLKYFMGLRHKEISSLMECSDSTIEKDLKFSRYWLSAQIA